MIRKYILPVLAALGVAVGIYAATRSARVTPAAPPVSAPARAPYRDFVAGAGIVEANTENIAIGTQVGGIVDRVWVSIGNRVKGGDTLFTLDDRAANAAVGAAEAAVQVAQSQLDTAKYELGLNEQLAGKSVTSVQQRDEARYAVATAQAQLANARANLATARTNLDLLTVRAPMDGQVLQLKVHPGEFATPGVLDQPLILFGHTDPLNVRVNVDENDAWRVLPSAPATGFLQGNKKIHTPLKFVRFEPYVVPKKSLTGQSTERVDTRVLQVIYSFPRGDLPIYAGQQMDVYIEAEAPGGKETNRPPPAEQALKPVFRN